MKVNVRILYNGTSLRNRTIWRRVAVDSIPVINKQTGEQPNYFGLPQVRENCGVELRLTHLADDDVAFSSFSASRIYQLSERGVPLVLASITDPSS